MHLFKQQAVFQLDQLPTHDMASHAALPAHWGAKAGRVSPATKCLDLQGLQRGESGSEMEMRACQNPLLLIRTSKVIIVVHVLP